MFGSLFQGFSRGFRRLRQSPQLIYTVIVALLIVLAFIFVVQSFLTVGITTQRRLITVRSGSILDTFVTFADDRIDDTNYLTEAMQSIKRSNTSIIDLRIVKPQDDHFIILASIQENEVGALDANNDQLYQAALRDTTHSFTQESVGNDRIYRTARAVTTPDDTVEAIVYISQQVPSLTIYKNIRDSILAFIFIMTVLMFLFLRQARIIDYVALYKRLKEVDQLKDDFISMASHELRAPIAVIKGYMDYIADFKNLDEKQQGYVTKAKKGTERLDLLVEDILDVSRLDQGRMKFNLEIFDPADIIRETADSFTDLAQEKGLALETTIQQSAMIQADKNKLKQVMTNLVSNAVKYTKQGKVLVHISADERYVRISVQDTGIGIPHREVHRLFKKFYRIQSEATKDIPGTGLGLWITAQIVHNMHGSIMLESKEGEGSRFTIRFPRV
jgi:signal transduction histidine kinase